jgi:hypothetical protein
MNSNYKKCINTSENVAWKIKDLLPDDYIFNFELPYLPNSLTLENSLHFLNDSEKLDLNHIRAVSYLNLFAFVEEYIIALEVKLASESIFQDNDRLRAILRFSEEEVKHQTLFRLYVEKFHEQFKTKCNLLVGADEVANLILSNSEMAVNILTYHLELITQQHYTESIKGNNDIDQHFTNILQKHWIEESQHAKLDLYEIERVRNELEEEELYDCLKEYLRILNDFSALLERQAEHNLDNLKKCTDRKWTQDEENYFIANQYFSYVNNFILMGLKNKTFQTIIKSFSDDCFNLIINKINSIEELFKEVENAA